MKYLKSHLKFNKQERSGIFFLMLLLILIQISYYIYSNTAFSASNAVAVDEQTQAQIALLKQNAMIKDTIKTYPFNPNFITDYKGYALGLSVDEIDRLHAFRSKNTYVNSAKEFQEVTLVSDSLLGIISPYFKFPDWVASTKTIVNQNSRKSNKRAVVLPEDLNTATEEDLRQVSGVGKTLAARIVKFRDRLGGFLIDEQLSDVYGLKPEVVELVLRQFSVLETPTIVKMNINTATAEELSDLVYIQKNVAYDIVAYRERNGGIGSFDELLQIETFPANRINRIGLYLSLKK